jgi:diguanylate cyclase (GGDEF)-like protein
MHEVTGRKRNEELLEHLAFVDLPTGLPNRAGLFEQLCKKIREHGGRAATLALLLLDLGQLREIQHTLNPRQGDALLNEVGRRLRSAIPDPDVVARSGEEFAVVVGGLAGHIELGAIAQRVQNVLHAPIIIERVPIALETAVGVALYPKDGTDPATLLQRADIARCAARSRGIGHALYEPSFQQQNVAGLSRMAELRVAIDRGELLLHFQPMIDLKSHTVCSVEALVRWHHPALGMLGPEEFIGAAERTGLIQPLAVWVVQAALQQSATWAKHGLRLTIAINLSARNLLYPQLPERITSWMRDHGVRADAIAVEITESATMTDAARSELVLRRLNELGIKISIDDFGVGYSSLSYLRRLPVDRLKIDRSFVANMNRNFSDSMIVRSIIELAHNLGLEVIAEGVETQEQYTQLAEWGCNAAQGYFISRPLPADQLADWIRISRWKPAQ